VSGHTRCQRRTALGQLGGLSDFQTPVRPTAIVEAHGPPTHPAVRAPGLRTCHGRADLPLVPETIGAMVTLYHTRVDRLVPQQIQYMLKPGFAMALSSCNALPPPTCVGLFPLPLGPPLAPAPPRTTPPPFGRVPPAAHLPECRLIAGTGSGETRRQVPCSQTMVGLLPHRQSLIIGPFAHPHGPHPLAVSGHGGLIPHVARCTPCRVGAAFWLLVTQLHCSSHSTAMGRRSRTCRSCKRSA
jgi:hypothetical protein